MYKQRPEDRILKKLVEKTETIYRQLGSVGQVLSNRITDLLDRKGLRDSSVDEELDALEEDPRLATALNEMDDVEEKRIEREARELKRMEELLKTSRQRVGIELTISKPLSPPP